MINRKLYTSYFRRDNLPNWRCPNCDSSLLKIKDDKFVSDNNSATELNKSEDWFDPIEMAELTFTALLECQNDKCKEVITCSGSGFVDYEYYINEYGEQDRYYERYFVPKYFYPPLHFFRIPDETPEDVINAILESFSLFFTNKSSSANQIRVALECLLTHLGIKRFENRKDKKTKKGYRYWLSLHERIQLLPEKYKSIKELCLAIKWLGNSGSHCGESLNSEDVFNAYDMISNLLDILYYNKNEHARKLAKKINRKKGK